MSNEAKKPFYKKWWFYVIIVIAVIIIVGVISAAVSGGGNGEDKTTGTGSNSTKVDQEVKYYVGDKVTSGSTDFTIDRIYERNEISIYSTEYTYVVIDITVQNNGKSEKRYDSQVFLLKNGGVTYKPDNAGIALENGFWLTLSVGAGLSKKTTLVFEIPTSYTRGEYYLEVDEGLFGVAQKIYLNK